MSRTMSEWPGGIAAVTLFMDDLEASKSFYETVFGLPVVFEDENSAVFRFGETLLNLLRSTEAPSLVAPASVAPAAAGVRFQFTLEVANVDAMCDELKKILEDKLGPGYADGAEEQVVDVLSGTRA